MVALRRRYFLEDGDRIIGSDDICEILAHHRAARSKKARVYRTSDYALLAEKPAITGRPFRLFPMVPGGRR